ncbi:hypothetical protein KP509_07G079000 [Ceratopteris richardii]|uniref:Uncharacterized protein n=1 Tax=Ceratopteris richardii TaxID=49495 RepID=A0A8T2UJW7_CERRI|nr:hypothetical protein KP509_07G079000 [Ceratopteris richardii]
MLLISWALVIDLKVAKARTGAAVLQKKVRYLAEGVDSVGGVSVPAQLVAPKGHSLHAVVRAEGHQHYVFNGTAWVLQNAVAELYADYPEESLRVGRHFFLSEPDAQGGQPTWELTSSATPLTSAVTGKSLASLTVDSNSIAWVLLKATSHSGNITEGTLGRVSYIQRLQTQHGLPPSTKGRRTGHAHHTKYLCIYAFYIQDPV